MSGFFWLLCFLAAGYFYLETRPTFKQFVLVCLMVLFVGIGL